MPVHRRPVRRWRVGRWPAAPVPLCPPASRSRARPRAAWPVRHRRSWSRRAATGCAARARWAARAGAAEQGRSGAGERCTAGELPRPPVGAAPRPAGVGDAPNRTRRQARAARGSLTLRHRRLACVASTRRPQRRVGRARPPLPVADLRPCVDRSRPTRRPSWPRRTGRPSAIVVPVAARRPAGLWPSPEGGAAGVPPW